jgi:hypothetical protein
MPILGKAANSARNFFGSDAGQALLSTLSVFVPGDPYGFVQKSRRQDEKRAQQQQQEQAKRDAISGLLSSYRGPDMETAGVNELIGGANETGARFDQAPMQRQDPRWQQGFDMGDPNTQSAFANYLGMGGSPADIKALQDMGRGPKPSYFNTRSGVVAVDPETGEANEVYSDPYAEALAKKQANSLDAQAYQRRAQGSAALTRAARPPAPRGGGGGGGAMTPRPTGKVY